MQYSLKRSASILVTVIVLIGNVATSGWADLYIKQTQHTGPIQIMGRSEPAKDEINEIWISGQKARFDGPEESSIVDMDKKSMVLINHVDKTYTEVAMGQMPGLPGDMGGGQNQQAFQAMAAAMMKTETQVVDTGEKKKIRNWNCRKYTVTIKMGMGQVVSEVWATEDIKVDPELFIQIQNAMAANQPGMAQTTEEMKKIKGFQVLSNSTSQTMGTTVTSSTEVLEVVTKAAPADRFKIPAGYTEE